MASSASSISAPSSSESDACAAAPSLLLPKAAADAFAAATNSDAMRRAYAGARCAPPSASASARRRRSVAGVSGAKRSAYAMHCAAASASRAARRGKGTPGPATPRAVPCAPVRYAASKEGQAAPKDTATRGAVHPRRPAEPQWNVRWLNSTALPAAAGTARMRCIASAVGRHARSASPLPSAATAAQSSPAL